MKTYLEGLKMFSIILGTGLFLAICSAAPFVAIGFGIHFLINHMWYWTIPCFLAAVGITGINIRIWA